MMLVDLLDDIYKLHMQIKRDYSLLSYYEHECGRISSPVYDEPRIDKTPSLRAPFEIWVLKKIDQERKIKKEEQELEELKMKALKGLETLQSEDWTLVLSYKYLSFMSYNQISKTMYISKSSVYRLVCEAEEAIKDLEV